METHDCEQIPCPWCDRRPALPPGLQPRPGEIVEDDAE